ncbi:sterol desaturase family protein [Pedobacter riviphilus]|uniref:sterol desaturase family protein n=1 Tax=Pedobacter riviphilus TaxID=2766984 RepID=UPI002E80F1DF|nr:sterol desaturase family protein [Pedobacter riviphilus]
MEPVINFIKSVIENLNGFGFPFLVFFLGVLEFSFGLYKGKWPKNERFVDIACFTLPRLVIRPVVAYYGLKFLPAVLPGLKNTFEWVPFFWGCIIIAIADDLTQYWYHRLHHEIPWLWRFHRTHHSAPYMGMAMASRQNAIYTLFFSQTYLTTALVYLGLGIPAIVVRELKVPSPPWRTRAFRGINLSINTKSCTPWPGYWKEQFLHLLPTMRIMQRQQMMAWVITRVTLAICFSYGILFLGQL